MQCSAMRQRTIQYSPDPCRCSCYVYHADQVSKGHLHNNIELPKILELSELVNLPDILELPEFLDILDILELPDSRELPEFLGLPEILELT